MQPSTFAFVRDFVFARAGIVLDAGKEYLVESRLAPLVAQFGFPTLDALAGKLAATDDTRLHRLVVEAMTTNETSFFRDIAPFEMLRHSVIPDLLERRRASQRLVIWCAAASTGQEPYSMAMLLREHFAELRSWTVQFVATDISTAVLERARAGVYSEHEVARGVPAPLLGKYFTRRDAGWQIGSDIRAMVDFREANLIAAWPALPPVDLVLMRNVLIYFDVATKRDILHRTRRIMAPDGHLLFGSAETTIGLDQEFERQQFTTGVTYRPTAAATLASPMGSVRTAA